MSNDNNNPPSSPPCYAPETDPAYQGYYTNEEIIRSLQPLLEAERAGTRISRETAADTTAHPEIHDLINDLEIDESRYCTMLLAQIRRLGGTPSTRTGDFHEKCMAISVLPSRLELLNRGQSWVVRKLNELMPRIQDPELLSALREMRDTHETNIDRMKVHLRVEP